MIVKSFHHRLDRQEHPHGGYCHPQIANVTLAHMQLFMSTAAGVEQLIFKRIT